MRIYIDKHEAHILHLSLLKLKSSYPNTYADEAQSLINKIMLAAQLQKSGKGVDLYE